jgi:hypothetical protein
VFGTDTRPRPSSAAHRRKDEPGPTVREAGGISREVRLRTPPRFPAVVAAGQIYQRPRQGAAGQIGRDDVGAKSAEHPDGVPHGRHERSGADRLGAGWRENSASRRSRRSKVDRRCRFTIDSSLAEEFDHVLLPWLAQRQPIEGEVVPQTFVPLPVSAKGIARQDSLDLGTAGVHPPRRELAVLLDSFGRPRGIEGCLPRIAVAAAEHVVPMRGGDVPSYRVASEAIHPAFALFEVDGAAREVPVDDGVAPPVEVDALLADARRHQDERGERAIEGSANGAVAHIGVVAEA